MKKKLAVAFLSVLLLFGSVFSAVGQAAETSTIRYLLLGRSGNWKKSSLAYVFDNVMNQMPVVAIKE